MRSVAVDRSKIPLGYPLFLSASNPITDKPINRVVFAQDTGGAIKGQVRADLFCGFGEEAEKLAGELKSPLQLYLLVPKNIAELTSTSSSLR
jgi:membrane-bound lytic murein transglycosylase A